MEAAKDSSTSGYGNEGQSHHVIWKLINNLKVLSGDYVVNISSKLISHWKNENIPVQYYIALEKTSTFKN